MTHLNKLAFFIFGLLLIAPAFSVVLHTSYGINLDNSSWNSTQRCSVYVISPVGYVIESYNIIPECVGSAISDSCYIYPIDTKLIFPIYLGEKYNTGVYQFCATCGVNTSCGNESISAPVLTVHGFSQYPQLFTTMKFTGQTEAEEATECTARILHDGVVTSSFSGIETQSKGLFSFGYLVLFEGAYDNYTLNVTCNDYSTYETTFKPVFIDTGTLITMSGGGATNLFFTGIILMVGLLFLAMGILVVKGLYGGLFNEII